MTKLDIFYINDILYLVKLDEGISHVQEECLDHFGRTAWVLPDFAPSVHRLGGSAFQHRLEYDMDRFGRYAGRLPSGSADAKAPSTDSKAKEVGDGYRPAAKLSGQISHENQRRPGADALGL